MPQENVVIQSTQYDGTGWSEIERETGKKHRVEVPFTLEGEKVDVFLKRGKKRRTWYGILQQVLEPSPQRREAKCPHFARCGGCRSQHLSYEEQLERKEKFLKELFEPFQTAQFHPIIPSPKEWHYRNKVEYTFSESKEREKFLGFIEARTKGRVIDIEACPLVEPWYQDLLIRVREWWKETKLPAYKMHNDTGSLRSLVVRQGLLTGDKLVVLVVSGNPDFALKKSHLESFKNAVKEVVGEDASIMVRIRQQIKGQPTQYYEMVLHGKGFFEEKIGELTFQVSPMSFLQPNTYAAEKLYDRGFELLNPSKEDVVYDLYCGIGTIGMCLSKRVKEVIGIEISKDSFYDLTVNRERLSIDNYIAFCGDVGRVLKEEASKKADAVIVDPPRQGLDARAIKHIIALEPKKILFISCNPSSQCENCIELEKAGYKVTHIQPVDQFPHTKHIENIVILEI